MQLALNLINEEKLKKLVKEASETDEELNELDEDTEESDSDIIDNEHSADKDAKEIDDIAMLILEFEEQKIKKVKQKSDSQDDSIKDVIKKINKKFKIKTKNKAKDKKKSLSEYLKSEFFNKNQYGINIQELFSYLDTGAKTDAYKSLYNKGKDKIYNFEDDMLSKEKQDVIIHKTKLARWMGYQGDSVYYAQDQVDAVSKEKWELIRNICFVHTLTMLRYDMSLS